MLHKIFLLLILTAASACFPLLSWLRGSSEDNGFDNKYYFDCQSNCYREHMRINEQEQYEKCLNKCTKNAKQ
ncbi:unnamed protein product [Cylicocyclus nassatus]|uniref:Uncharacterized protein n=1 Tax=Cylicocyclus nassatus TaxID=53992 RepID=A0AA36H0S3_CYLNA|nr:unnamed protein product [Cylicocyclus nassatus]